MEYQYLSNSDGTVIFGTNGELDLSSPTCTIDEGMARYAYVAQVLAAIDERLRKCKPPPMKLPRIQEICRGQDEAKHAARVPEAFQRGFLLKNINTIVGSPTLNSVLPEQNAAIWFYDSDLGHSFSHRIFNIRYNVIVMVFLWALDLAGDAEDGKPWSEFINPSDGRGRVRKAFWIAYVEAWMEVLQPEGNFTAQIKFLELW
ncbi:hypothetical protein PMIN06_004068 [Paraphaeosphaeria minitans]